MMIFNAVGYAVIVFILDYIKNYVAQYQQFITSVDQVLFGLKQSESKK